MPDCSTAGVLGVLPGTVGCLQATEVVKWIVGEGESLDGRLLAFDASAMSFDEVPVNRNPDCPVCGEDPSVEAVRGISYDGRCSLSD